MTPHNIPERPHTPAAHARETIVLRNRVTMALLLSLTFLGIPVTFGLAYQEGRRDGPLHEFGACNACPPAVIPERAPPEPSLCPQLGPVSLRRTYSSEAWRVEVVLWVPAEPGKWLVGSATQMRDVVFTLDPKLRCMEIWDQLGNLLAQENDLRDANTAPVGLEYPLHASVHPRGALGAATLKRVPIRYTLAIPLVFDGTARVWLRNWEGAWPRFQNEEGGIVSGRPSYPGQNHDGTWVGDGWGFREATP